MNTNGFEEQEIDLVDFLWKLLEQWRGVLLIGVATAILVLYGMSIKDTISSDDDTTTTEDSESDTDSISVESEYQLATTAISQYTSYIIARDSYENTILSQEDFSNCNYVQAIYAIKSSSSSEELFVINNIYNSIANDEEFNNRLAQLFSDSIDPDSIYSIMSITASSNTSNENSSSGTITISINLPQRIDTDLWQSTLTSALETYCLKMQDTVGQHTLSLVSFNKKQISGNSVIQLQNDKENDIVTKETVYKNTLDSMLPGTQELVQEIIDGQTTYEYSVYIDSLDQKWETYANVLQTQIGEIAADIESNDDTVSGDVSGEGYSELFLLVIKRLLIGFIVGLFLYACAYMAYIILFRVFRSDDELARITSLRNFGGIYEYPYETKLGRYLHDKRIYNYRRQRGRGFSEIVDDLFVKMEYSNANSLTFTVAGSMKYTMKSIVDSQINFLNEKGLNIGFLNTVDLSQSFEDSAFANIDNAFLVLIGGKTKYSDVEKLFAKFKEYDVRVMGYEYIEM